MALSRETRRMLRTISIIVGACAGSAFTIKGAIVYFWEDGDFWPWAWTSLALTGFSIVSLVVYYYAPAQRRKRALAAYRQQQKAARSISQEPPELSRT